VGVNQSSTYQQNDIAFDNATLTAVSVPGPGSCALLVNGLAGLALVWRRRV